MFSATRYWTHTIYALMQNVFTQNLSTAFSNVFICLGITLKFLENAFPYVIINKNIHLIRLLHREHSIGIITSAFTKQTFIEPNYTIFLINLLILVTASKPIVSSHTKNRVTIKTLWRLSPASSQILSV